MIQRIQSIWLFLAAFAAAGLLYFNLYTYHALENAVDTAKQFKANDKYGLFVLAILLIILPLVNIFMFKNRKRQKGLAALSIVVAIGFIAVMVMLVTNLTNNTPPPSSGSYGIGAIMPILSIIFLALAISGIRKDEKLVKSLDRLR
ncbi:MAG: DUF4293 domain-containing protein [Bacteroidetes bacterium]|nr:DUF4293 domain-containing protein [Bacteroidota bacterium]